MGRYVLFISETARKIRVISELAGRLNIFFAAAWRTTGDLKASKDGSSSNARVYQFQDARGSVIALANSARGLPSGRATGLVTEQYAYTAFGYPRDSQDGCYFSSFCTRRRAELQLKS